MLPDQSIDRRYLLRKYEQSKIFLVADLHLGFDIAISRRFDTYEPRWSFEIINNLKMDLEQTTPNYLIILGDLEHTFVPPKSSEISHEKRLASITQQKEKIFSLFQKQIVNFDGLDVILITGEHDTSIIDFLGDSVATFTSMGTSLLNNRLGVFHGNMKPNEKLLLSSEIMLGHIHPLVEFIDELQIRHKLPVFAKMTLIREELFKIMGFEMDLDDLFDFSLIDPVPIIILPSYNPHLPLSNSLILNKPRGIQKKTKLYPELRNILKDPKLNINLTDGVDIGFLRDLN